MQDNAFTCSVADMN